MKIAPQRVSPDPAHVEFFVARRQDVDVAENAPTRPGDDAAAIRVDDVGQGTGGGPGRRSVVVVSSKAVGEIDRDIRMPLHEAVIVLRPTRTEGRFPVPSEGLLNRVLGAGDAAQRTKPRERNAGTTGGRQLQQVAACESCYRSLTIHALYIPIHIVHSRRQATVRRESPLMHSKLIARIACRQPRM